MANGFTLWFTGLSGAGKSTIAELVGAELEKNDHKVEYLDGDVVRTHLSKGLGFSKEDRDTNIERIGWVASRLTRHGAAVLVSAISPYEETRRKARELVEEFGSFVEVHVAASVDECARRDVKGLYEKAFRGEITRTQLRRTLSRLADDIRSGRWQLPRYALTDVYRKAEELSGRHAASTGCRSLDILHVAGALVLGVRTFLTFDTRQGKLARKARLRVLPATT